VNAGTAIQQPLIYEPYAESDSGNTHPPACVGQQKNQLQGSLAVPELPRRVADCLGAELDPLPPGRRVFAQPEQGSVNRPLVSCRGHARAFLRRRQHGQCPNRVPQALAGAAWAVVKGIWLWLWRLARATATTTHKRRPGTKRKLEQVGRDMPAAASPSPQQLELSPVRPASALSGNGPNLVLPGVNVNGVKKSTNAAPFAAGRPTQPRRG